MEVKRLIKRMLVYSAIKIRANLPLEYSVLKPDTNSDSPSAKSKGVRLVSANKVMHQEIRRSGNIVAVGIGELRGRWVREREKASVKGLNRIRSILIS